MSNILAHKQVDPQYISFEGAKIVLQLFKARRKLLNEEVPNRLKMVSYLRLSCSASTKHKKINISLDGQTYQGVHFYTLLRLLSEHDACWWENCFVAENGTLDSYDSTLHDLLSPLIQLHALQYSGQI